MNEKIERMKMLYVRSVEGFKEIDRLQGEINNLKEQLYKDIDGAGELAYQIIKEMYGDDNIYDWQWNSDGSITVTVKEEVIYRIGNDI